MQDPLIPPTPEDLEHALAVLTGAQSDYTLAAQEAAAATAAKKQASEALGKAVASVIRIRTQLRLDAARARAHEAVAAEGTETEAF